MADRDRCQWRHWRRYAVAAGTAALAIASGSAAAAPLDEKTCARLKETQAASVGGAARQHLERGAAWAKANLTKQQISQVLILIELDEAIKFRCPEKRIDEKAKSAPARKGKAAKREAKAAPGNARPPAAKPATGAKAAAEASPAIKPQRSPAASRPAPKPKPKVNDAYVPPPKLPGFEN